MSKLLKDNRVHIEKVGYPSHQSSKVTPGPDLAKTQGENGP